MVFLFLSFVIFSENEYEVDDKTVVGKDKTQVELEVEYNDSLTNK